MGLLLRFVRILPLAAVAAIPVIASAACNAQLATVLSSDGGTDSSTGGASCTSDPDCNDNPAISSLRGRCTNGVCVCNADVAPTPNGKCGDLPRDAGPVNDCVAKGGMCLGPKSTPAPPYRLAEKGEGTCAGTAQCWVTGPAQPPICFMDQQCNGDSTVSALWGTCFFGVCMCKPGYTVQPNGKCNTPPPPECATQKGTCRQDPAECLTDELDSAQQTDMSCGDLIAAVCCNKKATCAGPAREAAGAGYVPVDFTCCSPAASPSEARAPICVNGYQTCPTGFTAVAKPGGC